MACPECGTRFRAAVAAAARITECLACSAAVPVPGRDDPADADAASAKRHPRAAEADGADRAAVALEVAADPERAAVRVPVWWKFVSGVFTFPLYQGVYSRWLLLSLGGVLTGLTTAMMIWFANVGWAAAVFALRMTWGWVTIWTFSYACACCLPIITETAAGCEQVEGWPDPDWRDWFVELLRMVLPTLATAAVAFALAVPVKLVLGAFWPPFLAGVFLLFPIVLLSTMEAGSILVPVTPAILVSLVSHWWAWLLFYAEAAILACVWPGLFVLGFSYQPFAVGALTGPLMAAVILIYARLLGRLGYAITHDR